MADLPGLDADIYFGEADKPLPDWRAEATEEDDEAEEDSDQPTPEQLINVKGMLGFDPRELESESE